MARNSAPVLLRIVRVGEETIAFSYLPKLACYAWVCSNGDSGTRFPSLEAAEIDAAGEVEWILAGKPQEGE